MHDTVAVNGQEGAGKTISIKDIQLDYLSRLTSTFLTTAGVTIFYFNIYLSLILSLVLLLIIGMVYWVGIMADISLSLLNYYKY